MIRVAAFIDGFNLYHAIQDLKRPHLKWVDLRKVILCFLDPKVHDLVGVYYFSAYATWLESAHKRHQAYVKALSVSGVTPLLGNFKEKERGCNKCGAGWTAHEEKESDVNLALSMVRGAYRDEYDEAFLICGDSDIAPSVRMIKADFPKKTIKVIAPPGRRHSKELSEIADKLAKIKDVHLERSLLPETLLDADGAAIARPAPYAPPA
ncbi:hypothetical protein BWI17_04545 [Betaproteobacteria bacterium GR16-43]|nr:hypothetical protein BWI17_04545 [Betaproteobacteria bacterium GR16-43]